MSVHESMKYACNLCGYKATQKNHLKSHKYLFHNNIVYLKTNLSKPYFIFNLCEKIKLRKNENKLVLRFIHLNSKDYFIQEGSSALKN